jgi:hypothetical protein
MKKILLPIIILIGSLSSLAAISLIRLSKNMEDWELAWDEDGEDNEF